MRVVPLQHGNQHRGTSRRSEVGRDPVQAGAELKEAEQIAEELAREACETLSKQYGWVMRYERRGNSFIIFTDGVPTNEIEIVPLQ